jgi:hypothetical protein
MMLYMRLGQEVFHDEMVVDVSRHLHTLLIRLQLLVLFYLSKHLNLSTFQTLY